MDRALRNIALITLLIASLTVVAVVSPEHHRSTTNTAILVLAVVTAAGSLLALVLGSVAFGVARKDVRSWRAERSGRRWNTRHYAAEEPQTGPRAFSFGPDESAIRAKGMPAFVVALQPATLGMATERLLQGVAVTCSVERRRHRWPFSAERVELTPNGDDIWGAVARWPDQWFDPGYGGPTPGRYRIQWKLRLPDGTVERPTDKVRVVAKGHAHVGHVARALGAGRRVVRHYRGLN
jgi:hypothetical protein